MWIELSQNKREILEIREIKKKWSPREKELKVGGVAWFWSVMKTVKRNTKLAFKGENNVSGT